MENFLVFIRVMLSCICPLALVYIMTGFRCSRKAARLSFIGVGLFGIAFNVLLSLLFGWDVMIRFFAVSVAVPCIILLLFLSEDRLSQHFFNFFTAINALYMVSIIGRVAQGMRGDILPDVIVKIVLFSLILHLFHRYWSKPYHFLSVNVKKGWGIISVIPFLFFALVMFMGLYPTVRTDNLVAAIFLYGILCCVYLVIYVVFRNTYDLLIREQEQQMLTLQLSAQKQYYEDRLGNEAEIHRLRHDMQGHLTTIAALLADGNTAEALGYLEKLTELHKNRQTKPICENPYFNAALSVFAGRFKEIGIPFEYRIQLETLAVPGPSLCLILNNALQNAEDAVMKLPEEERTVRFWTTVKQAQLLIRVSNRFCGTLREENGLPVTTKSGQGHGYGLTSLRAAAEQLGGDVSYSARDGWFELDISIPETAAATDAGTSRPRKGA